MQVFTPKVNGESPWGRIQDARQIADGIVSVSTASHGGFHLSDERNRNIHPALRANDGWYEEDICVYIVIWYFPNECYAYYLQHAENPVEFQNYVTQTEKVLKDWFPDAYEKATGNKIATKDSYKRRKAQFQAENSENWVVRSAIRCKNDADSVIVLATLGEDRQTGKYFRVSSQKYEKRNPFGYVVDEMMDEPATEADFYAQYG